MTQRYPLARLRYPVQAVCGPVRDARCENRTPGRHEVVWDGRDDDGREASSGVYLYRLEAGPYDETKRMIMVK